MANLLFVLGTRPEVIKLAPVIAAFRAHGAPFSVQVCVTGQHRQLLDQMLNIFSIKPDFDLNLMQENQTLASLTGRIINSVNDLLAREKPDWIFVQGDTTTVMAASLAAYYNNIKVALIEAGLRTGDKYSPFPEEINRRVAACVADLHLAPTKWARQNLLRENVGPEKIHVTGNTAIDALLYMREKNKTHGPELMEKLTGLGLPADLSKMVLITGHRRENFGTGFREICLAIRELAALHPECLFLYPVHLNPNVQKPVFEIIGNVPNVKLLPPLGYPEFVFLMEKSYLILTDSGGVQEEAPSLGKPVLVMRTTTERPEAVQANTAKLVGANKETIIANVRLLLENKDEYNRMAAAINPYGDGKASQRILAIFNSLLK